jgi:hypothetical protein
VLSDIVIPSPFATARFDESSLPHALPWDEIRPAPGFSSVRQRTVSDAMLQELRRSSLAREAGEPQLQFEKRLNARFNVVGDEKDLPLSLEARKLEKAEMERLAAEESGLKKTVPMPAAKPYDFGGKAFENPLDIGLLEAIDIAADWVGLAERK